jgi:3-methyladenine DNA glycosylase AlkD
VKTSEAKELGITAAALVNSYQIEPAYAELAPVLAERTPFKMLRHIGEAVGVGPLDGVNSFMDRVAQGRTIGGWVIIGRALEEQMERDLVGVFQRCRGFIIDANVWHAADALAEQVPGRALVACFETALKHLVRWCKDGNRWVRRAVGVSVHYWAKRSRGEEALKQQADALLDLVEPMFEEHEMDAAKGVGWGLKTLGRTYPELMAEWLHTQVARRGRPHRAVMLRKALTYLSEEQRAFVTKQIVP